MTHHQHQHRQGRGEQHGQQAGGQQMGGQGMSEQMESQGQQGGTRSGQQGGTQMHGGTQQGGTQGQSQPHTFDDHLTDELWIALEDFSELSHVAAWCAKECATGQPELGICARICQDIAEIAALNEMLIARDSMFGPEVADMFIRIANEGLSELRQYEQRHPHVTETIATIERTMNSCETVLEQVDGSQMGTGGQQMMQGGQQSQMGMQGGQQSGGMQGGQQSQMGTQGGQGGQPSQMGMQGGQHSSGMQGMPEQGQYGQGMSGQPTGGYGRMNQQR